MADGLAGKRVLVVEDEAYVALDLRALLRDEGAVVIGPASDSTAAEAMLDGDAPDAAVLDVNLDGVTSYDLADSLSARGIPVMLMTGYDGWSLPKRAQAFPRIAKPYENRIFLDMVQRLCTGDAA